MFLDWYDPSFVSQPGTWWLNTEQHTLRTLEWRVGERDPFIASGNHWSASAEVIVQNSSRETKDCQFQVWLYKEVCRFESGSLWFLLGWKISWTLRRSSKGRYKLSTTARLTTCKYFDKIDEINTLPSTRMYDWNKFLNTILASDFMETHFGWNQNSETVPLPLCFVLVWLSYRLTNFLKGTRMLS